MRLHKLLEKYICCPYDYDKLQIGRQAYDEVATLICAECGRKWNTVDGIISMMPDYFYGYETSRSDNESEDRLTEIEARDDQAQEYEKILTRRRTIIELNTTMREFHPDPEDVVVELGVGTGRTLEYSDRCGIVFGCDFSLQSLKELRAKGFQNVIPVQADATLLPFQNQCIDKIISVELFHHIPTQQLRRKYLSECKRVLRDDGEILMSGIYNFTIRKRLRDIKMVYTKDDHHGGADGKMGYHTNNKIFYYNYDIRELKAEVKRYFKVLDAFGFLVDIGRFGRIIDKILGPYKSDCIWQRTIIGKWFGRALLIRMKKSG